MSPVQAKLTFEHFGITQPHEHVSAVIAQLFHERFPTGVTVDELLLHPRDAMRFCDSVRDRQGWIGIPDDVILRALLNRRKRGEL